MGFFANVKSDQTTGLSGLLGTILIPCELNGIYYGGAAMARLAAAFDSFGSLHRTFVPLCLHAKDCPSRIIHFMVRLSSECRAPIHASRARSVLIYTSVYAQ